jgi:signal transduction histidine kinase
VRILVADDHEVIRRGVRALLAAGRDCEICGEAVDGQDAVEKAHQLHPDLIIMDVSMPNLNGLEATRLIRRSLPSTQVLILTQHDSQEMIRQAFNAGARGFVVKSSVAHDLLHAVEAARRGEAFFDSTAAPRVSPSGRPADAKTILERETALERALRESEERKEAEARLKVAHDELEARVNQRTAELSAAENGLRLLSGRLMQLQDEERRRISRELHDSSGQALAALSMCLSMVEREADKLSERAGRNLSDATRLVRELSQEVRTMSHLLHPPLLDEAGLESALHWFVEGFAQRSGIKVDLELAPELGRLSKEMEIAIFRIVQESLANVHRHSGSKTAQVRVGRDSQKVTLEICDQGHGLRTNGHAEKSGPALPGVGIRGMRERVRQLGGHFEIQSAEGGTVLRAAIPLPAAEAAPVNKVTQTST